MQGLLIITLLSKFVRSDEDETLERLKGLGKTAATSAVVAGVGTLFPPFAWVYAGYQMVKGVVDAPEGKKLEAVGRGAVGFGIALIPGGPAVQILAKPVVNVAANAAITKVQGEDLDPEDLIWDLANGVVSATATQASTKVTQSISDKVNDAHAKSKVKAKRQENARKAREARIAAKQGIPPELPSQEPSPPKQDAEVKAKRQENVRKARAARAVKAVENGKEVAVLHEWYGIDVRPKTDADALAYARGMQLYDKDNRPLDSNTVRFTKSEIHDKGLRHRHFEAQNDKGKYVRAKTVYNGNVNSIHVIDVPNQPLKFELERPYMNSREEKDEEEN